MADPLLGICWAKKIIRNRSVLVQAQKLNGRHVDNCSILLVGLILAQTIEFSLVDIWYILSWFILENNVLLFLLNESRLGPPCVILDIWAWLRLVSCSRSRQGCPSHLWIELSSQPLLYELNKSQLSLLFLGSAILVGSKGRHWCSQMLPSMSYPISPWYLSLWRMAYSYLSIWR